MNGFDRFGGLRNIIMTIRVQYYTDDRFGKFGITKQMRNIYKYNITYTYNNLLKYMNINPTVVHYLKAPSITLGYIIIILYFVFFFFCKFLFLVLPI